MGGDTECHEQRLQSDLESLARAVFQSKWKAVESAMQDTKYSNRTVTYVANYFDDEDHFAEKFLDDDAALAHRLWRLCDEASQGLAIASSRSWTSSTAACPRQAPSSSGLVRPGNLQATRIARAACWSSGERKKRTCDVASPDAVCQRLLGMVRSAGVHSGWHETLRQLPCEAEVVFQRTWSALVGKSGLAGARAHIGAWSRWSRFVARAASTPLSERWAPQPWTVAAFLQEVGGQGPTEAAGVANHLRWMSRRLRLDLQLDHALVAPLLSTPRMHVPLQAMPLEVKMRVHFEILSQSSSAFIAHAADLTLTVAYATRREVHVQRSCLIKGDGTRVSLRVREG